MEDVLETIISLWFYILDFLFSLIIFDDVSIGSIMIVCTIFAILFRYLVAVPKVMPRKRERYYDVYKNNEFNGYDHRRHYYK